MFLYLFLKHNNKIDKNKIKVLELEIEEVKGLEIEADKRDSDELNKEEKPKWYDIFKRKRQSLWRVSRKIRIEKYILRRDFMEKKGCMKCGSMEAGTKEIAATGTGLSKIFDIP